MGGWVIESAPMRIPPSILANDVKHELLALLEGMMDEDALKSAAESAVLEYKGLDAAALLDDEQKDYIVDLQGIILAFAGRVLLQRTNFSLERGKTYGIVGQNGTGKTTLLNRVAAKDIAGFPPDVSVYYIQHEILSEKEETIVDFMVQMVPEGVSRETVVNTLKEVGFDDVKMAATIQSLSGGWRMKLAIARAMLWDAEVLLLDKNIARLRQVDAIYQGHMQTVASNAYEIERAVLDADLVIGAVLVPGAKAPTLVSNELVSRMKKGSVLVDIAIDQGGCFEDSRPTTHADPTFPVHDSVFYCVANMPGAVPHTSTYALTNVTLPYAVEIADHGWRGALARDAALRPGLNVHAGHITYPAVAEAFGLPAVALEDVLA